MTDCQHLHLDDYPEALRLRALVVAEIGGGRMTAGGGPGRATRVRSAAARRRSHSWPC